jgi:hypothetical protein
MEPYTLGWWILMVLTVPLVAMHEIVPMIIVAGILELGRRMEKEEK